MRPFHDDPEVLREARATLAQLVPEALRRMETEEGRSAVADTRWRPLAEPMIPYLRTDNILGVYLFEEGGRWYFEVVLRSTPAHVGDVIGSYPVQPKTSREEALEAAQGLLCIIVGFEQGVLAGNPDKSKNPVFLLEGYSFEFDADGVERTGREVENVPMHYVLGVLEEILDRNFADGFTPSGLDALPEEEKAAIYGCMSILLSRRIFRFCRRGGVATRVH